MEIAFQQCQDFHMPNKHAVSVFLIFHLLISWGAVAARIDRFPLTWAPMYAIYSRPNQPAPGAKSNSAGSEKSAREVSSASTGAHHADSAAKIIVKKITIKDKERLKKKGWVATRRDGQTMNVGARDLNVPRRSMRRLYYDRTFGKAPFNYKQRNYDAGNWDRWLWGLAPGEDYITHDWRRRLLVSVNKTFSLEPEDAGFIVSLEAYYDKKILYEDGSASIEERSKAGRAEWNDKWEAEWAEGNW